MNTIKDIFLALIDTIKKNNLNVGKVKFVKLLYLMEWRYAQLNNSRLTDLDWKFWHYGPYPMNFESVLEEAGIKPPKFQLDDDMDFYNFLHVTTSEYNVSRPILNLMESIIQEWGSQDTNKLLDYVYFRTDPMVNAKRSQDINFFISHPHLHYTKPETIFISKDTKKKIKELVKNLNNKIENDKVPGPPAIVDEYLQQALLQMDTLND
jgi:uncharacterized phage-associated protein